jgi:uncharacterized protein with HEPN domain
MLRRSCSHRHDQAAASCHHPRRGTACPGDFRVYLDDILAAIEKVSGIPLAFLSKSLRSTRKTVDAVIRNLEIVGEAIKKVPGEIRAAHSEVDWAKIAGLRDILIHEYFGIDTMILWDIVQNKLPQLQEQVRRILTEMKNP